MLATLELQSEGFHRHTPFSDIAYISTLWIQVGLEKVRDKNQKYQPPSRISSGDTTGSTGHSYNL